MCQKCVDNHWYNLFWVLNINFCHFSPQKWYRNPLLGHFVPPKEYGRHCHRYLGKFKFFGSIGSQKVAKKNCPPAICRVKKMWKNIVILVDIEVVCTINLPNSSNIQNAPTIRLMNHRLEIKKILKYKWALGFLILV